MYEGAAQAIGWIRDVRATSERIDRGANGLIEQFRRLRNQATRLGQAAKNPVAIGFFGLSQAGKSYLISALAANEKGELETDMGPHHLNFISHINPPGGGKEATGLVTRFTRLPGAAPALHPVELRLFREADIVKIIGNSFFYDFDAQKVSINGDADTIRSLLSRLSSRRLPQKSAGFSEDDVVDVMDYFQSRFEKAMQPLMGDFWPSAIELAPWLPMDARAELFSVLWGDIAPLTECYRLLVTSLEAAGQTEKVCAPIEALVKPLGNGAYSQQDNIMNVDVVLNRLGRDGQDRVGVIKGGDASGHTVFIPRSVLAALTMEMRFVLSEKPAAGLLETVDLLDFPGYRGRLDIGGIEEIGRAVNNADSDPVAELFLRGKVAYLFERYTDDQEMNVLTVCTPCNEQINVSSLGSVLQNWINFTQGETPEMRGSRKAGLVWCITKFDYKLMPKPGETLENIRMEWAGMMQATLLERFGKYPWLQEWAKGKPFNNLFLVRKPRMASAVIDTADKERAIKPEQQDRLNSMRRSFCEIDSVTRHFASPEEAWDAVMTLNDGGIGRLAAYLASLAGRDAKIRRIEEQVLRLCDQSVGHDLGIYYQSDGNEEMAKKKVIAAAVREMLRKRASSIGLLIHHLAPPAEWLRNAYLKNSSDEQETTDNEGLIDLSGLMGKQHANAPGRGFARVAISEWIAHMRRLPANTGLLRYLGYSDMGVQQIVDELIVGAHRTRLEDAIAEALSEGEVQTSSSRAFLADRQVLIARNLIGQFIEMLGQEQLPRQEKADSEVSGRKVFTPPPVIPPGSLPELGDTPVNFSAIYITDWLQAFAALAVENAGHHAGREISMEQNARLGDILAFFSTAVSEGHMPHLKGYA